MTPSPEQLATWLDTAADILDGVSGQFIAGHRADSAVAKKGNDFATEIDLAIERRVVAELTERTGIGVHGEEFGGEPVDVRRVGRLHAGGRVLGVAVAPASVIAPHPAFGAGLCRVDIGLVIKEVELLHRGRRGRRCHTGHRNDGPLSGRQREGGASKRRGNSWVKSGPACASRTSLGGAHLRRPPEPTRGGSRR